MKIVLFIFGSVNDYVYICVANDNDNKGTKNFMKNKNEALSDIFRQFGYAMIGIADELLSDSDDDIVIPEADEGLIHYVSVEDAAIRMMCSRPTVLHRWANGLIEGKRVGRKLLINELSIETYNKKINKKTKQLPN